jgi:2-methylcitrate dehydratase PrpD
MTKVSARPNAAYTDDYPQRMLAMITVRLTDGTVFSREVQDYRGMPPHPFTSDDVTGKFDQLVGRPHRQRPCEPDQGCRSLEHIHVHDLMTLLARVRAG